MSEEKIRHIIEVFENDYCEKCSEFNCLEGSMEEIITAMKQLQQENQELKLELSGYRQAILEDKDMLGLKEENQELKKQLEENKDKINWYENFEINKTIDKLRIKHNNQQKEFIEYLEDLIKEKLFKIIDILNELGDKEVE